VTSQLWLRRYHPGWYRKYNYILGGALDGGAQVMIFILSFAVFGAAGVSRPFPTVKLTSLSPFSQTPNVMIFLFRYFPSFFSSGLETLPRGTWIIAMEMGRSTRARDDGFCEL
jgi:hypothetical protein